MPPRKVPVKTAPAPHGYDRMHTLRYDAVLRAQVHRSISVLLSSTLLPANERVWWSDLRREVEAL